jgi:L-seryl-tRNA(Ser) seleniumtransferase
MPTFRVIPSIEQLLDREPLRIASVRHGRDAITRAARQAADELRARLTEHHADNAMTDSAAAEWLVERTLTIAMAYAQPSLRRVINATGVIIHTNLGRAPIAPAALANARLAEGYSNLEYDLGRGERGHRHVHAERLLCALTGAESAVVVNNTAAAALLALASLASGREVIVSRGELVEIGGGFRVPDVLAQSGATLREVGTTNRTRVGDYAASINDRTAAILRVHPSNFRIEGFTERPDLGELTALAHRFNLPLIEDLGSGWLGLPADLSAEASAKAEALADEPSVRASVEAGADLVLFSGDKLLGGPQAGLIVGRTAFVDRLRTHPLMRALRVDKLTYAVLEATLALWSETPSRADIPVFRMLTMSIAELDARARDLSNQLAGLPGVRATVIDGASTTGGGSAPDSALPTRLVTVVVDGLSASALDAALRHARIPVVARIENDVVVIDVRTVRDDELSEILAAVKYVVGGL